MVHGQYQPNGLFGGLAEVGLEVGERLHADGDIEVLARRKGGLKRFDGIVERLVVREFLEDIALFRRPEDHHLAAHVGAALGKVAQVLGGPVADGLVRMVQVQVVRAHEDPMEPDNVEPHFFGLGDDAAARILRDIRHVLG